MTGVAACPVLPAALVPELAGAVVQATAGSAAASAKASAKAGAVRGRRHHGRVQDFQSATKAENTELSTDADDSWGSGLEYADGRVFA
jgi:hypothetical protein